MSFYFVFLSNYNYKRHYILFSCLKKLFTTWEIKFYIKTKFLLLFENNTCIIKIRDDHAKPGFLCNTNDIIFYNID